MTYIVASAVKCEKFFPNSKNEGPSFRMHAVILNKNGMNSYREKILNRNNISNSNSKEINKDGNNGIEYILCHIRKIDCDYKLSKLAKTSENPSEEEKLEIIERNLKTKKIKNEENSEQKKIPIKEDFPLNNYEELKQETVEKSENFDFNNSLTLKFRKMNVNLFQLFCVHQVIDKNFKNMVNEFCEIPEKKRNYEKNFFPNVIHQELAKSGEEECKRDYAKMFNMMN